MQTTMREANDRGYDSLLVDEATASYFPAFKVATVETVSYTHLAVLEAIGSA